MRNAKKLLQKKISGEIIKLQNAIPRKEKEMEGTFNINLFKAALASKGMTQDDLAKILEISRNTLRLKVKRNGDFRTSEIAIMREIFGKKVVDAFLFN